GTNAKMFFESILINVSVMLVLIGALIFDYVTKFFSYWYIRHVQYKMPLPFFGSDYHRVLGLRSTTDEVDALYTKYPKEKYVGCIKSRIPDLIVKDPEAVRKTLSTDFSNFHYRGCELDKSRDICLRNNLFYAEGEKWTFLRRKYELLLKHMSDDIQDSLHDCVSGSSGDLRVQQILTGILDVVFKDLLLDNNVDTSVIKNIRETMEKRSLGGKLKSYLKDIFPSVYVLFGFSDVSAAHLKELNKYSSSSRLLKCIKKVDVLTNDELNVNRKIKLQESDYFYSSFLLFISEGYIPCYNVLVALLYELALHQDVQNQARKCAVNSDDDYLNRVIKETLRLHPPYSVITRKCTRTYTFPEQDFHINNGMNITVPVANLHKDEAFFKKSKEFYPDRFSDSESEKTPAFLPFGLGPRQCIGEQLALKIVRSVTCAILKKFKIEKTDKTPTSLPVVDYNLKRVIDKDIWLRFQPIES
ncbi:cytochrome P450 6j1-like, partial [Aricia agestis]|uniref:cytochrome P450 6j1-like n=1 Tax=Aricia agestis TaxID=91739 RepID=UPI001C20781E